MDSTELRKISDPCVHWWIRSLILQALSANRGPHHTKKSGVRWLHEVCSSMTFMSTKTTQIKASFCLLWTVTCALEQWWQNAILKLKRTSITYHNNLNIFDEAIDLERVSLFDEEAAPVIFHQVLSQNDQNGFWRWHVLIKAGYPRPSLQGIPGLEVERKLTLVVLVLIMHRWSIVQLR